MIDAIQYEDIVLIGRQPAHVPTAAALHKSPPRPLRSRLGTRSIRFGGLG